VTRDTIGTALAVVAAVAGVVAIVTRPFLCVPIGLLCLLVATKLTRDQRFTRPAAALLVVGALAGTAVAAGFTNPLY
jgi:hypothetical protein